MMFEKHFNESQPSFYDFDSIRGYMILSTQITRIAIHLDYKNSLFGILHIQNRFDIRPKYFYLV